MDELKENLKTLLRKAITNAKDGDEKGQWITINGTHVFIPEGKTAEDVIKEKGWKDKGEGKEKSDGNNEDKHGFKKDKDSGYYMKDLSDGTSVYVEKKKGGQGEKEPFYLEATHFDKDGKEIAKKQYHYDSMDGMFSKIDKDFVSKDNPSEGKKEIKKIKISGVGTGLDDLAYKAYPAQVEELEKRGEIPKDIYKNGGTLGRAAVFKALIDKHKNETLGQICEALNKSNITYTNWEVADGYNKEDKINDYGESGIYLTAGFGGNKGSLKLVSEDNIDNSIQNGLSEIIKNCKPETKEDLKILKGLKDILEEQ